MSKQTVGSAEFSHPCYVVTAGDAAGSGDDDDVLSALDLSLERATTTDTITTTAAGAGAGAQYSSNGATATSRRSGFGFSGSFDLTSQQSYDSTAGSPPPPSTTVCPPATNGHNEGSRRSSLLVVDTTITTTSSAVVPGGIRELKAGSALLSVLPLPPRALFGTGTTYLHPESRQQLREYQEERIEIFSDAPTTFGTVAELLELIGSFVAGERGSVAEAEEATTLADSHRRHIESSYLLRSLYHASLRQRKRNILSMASVCSLWRKVLLFDRYPHLHEEISSYKTGLASIKDDYRIKRTKAQEDVKKAKEEDQAYHTSVSIWRQRLESPNDGDFFAPVTEDGGQLADKNLRIIRGGGSSCRWPPVFITLLFLMSFFPTVAMVLLVTVGGGLEKYPTGGNAFLQGIWPFWMFQGLFGGLSFLFGLKVLCFGDDDEKRKFSFTLFGSWVFALGTECLAAVAYANILDQELEMKVIKGSEAEIFFRISFALLCLSLVTTLLSLALVKRRDILRLFIACMESNQKTSNRSKGNVKRTQQALDQLAEHHNEEMTAFKEKHCSSSDERLFFWAAYGIF